MAHSKVGASSMERWRHCPGSVRLSEGLDSPTSQFAAEGTAAHHLAEMCLNGSINAADYQGRFITVMKSGAGNGYIHKKGEPGEFDNRFVFTVDEEMTDNVQVYLNAVREELARESNAELLVEQRFHLASLHEGLFGTSDAVVWLPEARELHPFDLKYGQGVPVEVIGNPQIRYYGLGALLETGYKAGEVVNHIVQPRCYHPDGPHRQERLDAMELLDFAGELLEAVQATEDPDAPLVPGPWCRWCPAAAICPKLKEEATKAAQMEFRSDLSYDPDQLAEALELAPIMEAWAKNVREFAYNQAEHGNPVPRHKLVEKRAQRKWRDEAEAARVVLAYLPEDEAYQTKLRTPAQIEKALGRDRKDVIEDVVTQESSGHVLVHESDKRPSVKPTAQEDFGDGQ